MFSKIGGFSVSLQSRTNRQIKFETLRLSWNAIVVFWPVLLLSCLSWFVTFLWCRESSKWCLGVRLWLIMPSPASPEETVPAWTHMLKYFWFPFWGRGGSNPWQESIEGYCEKPSPAVECSLRFACFCPAVIEHGHFWIYPYPATFLSLFARVRQNAAFQAVSLSLPILNWKYSFTASVLRGLQNAQKCAHILAGKVVHRNYEQLPLSPLLLSRQQVNLAHKHPTKIFSLPTEYT